YRDWSSDVCSSDLRGAPPQSDEAGEPAAAEGRVLAGQSPQRRLLLGWYQTNGDGDLWLDGIREGKPRIGSKLQSGSLRKWQTGSGAPVHRRGRIQSRAAGSAPQRCATLARQE